MMTFDSTDEQNRNYPHKPLNQAQSDKEDKTRFIAYPKALALLKDRLDVTPEAMAAWVFLGPDQGGFAAYVNANEFDTPPRFYYYDNHQEMDYLTPLMGYWFNEDELKRFQPAERFMAGKELSTRWRFYPDLQVEAFIQAKIRESRLLDIHPITDGTEVSNNESFPLLETALFIRSHVKAIEIADFEGRKVRQISISEQAAKRNQRLQDDANALAREWEQKGRRSFSKAQIAQTLAQSEEWKEVESGTIERLIRVEWNSKP